MSKRDQRDYEAAKKMLAVHEPNIVKLNESMASSVTFTARLWSEDPQTRAEFRQYMAEYPDEFRARFTSSLFFLRILASRQPKEPPQSKPRLTTEELEKMELTDEQIEKLAGVNGNG